MELMSLENSWISKVAQRYLFTATLAFVFQGCGAPLEDGADEVDDQRDDDQQDGDDDEDGGSGHGSLLSSRRR